ncbi:ABC transporter permease [Pandoraea cepalis]|uniref:ABC transporter permease n=1 Tax=Pandoraea cepalis TaxID=2508294 RepID=A0A5E4UGK8_9BURK|nr:ABC transporter permease [Pandoraea cepalis]VVD99155.1 ABC transporter permease [Pandoraea cepalis]
MKSLSKTQLTVGSFMLLLIFAAIWQWGPTAFGVPEFVLPKLSSTVIEGARMFQVENLWLHIGVTAIEVIAGFVIGSALGVVIGVVLGLSPSTEAMLSPYILALQIAPKVAFAPLFVMWMGYTIYPKILVAVLIVFFPVMINVLGAVRAVDPDMVNLVRALCGRRWQIFRFVEFPSAMQALFAGLRIASTLAVIGVTVGELVGGDRGLGYLLVYGEGQGNTAMVFVSIAGLTVIGIAAYAAVVWLERRALHYVPRAAMNIA